VHHTAFFPVPADRFAPSDRNVAACCPAAGSSLPWWTSGDL